MTPFNENWERWCKISAIKHFYAGRGDTDFFVEGFARDTEGKQDWLEFRMDGPYIKEQVKQQWRLYFEINILVVVQESHDDAYRINKLTGRVSSLFPDCITVRQWEEGVDDPAIVGCLCLVPTPKNERIQVSHFGKINPSVGIYQASVEGHYHINFD